MSLLTQASPKGTPVRPGADEYIRPVETVNEYRQCEELQTKVWGPHDIVGVPLLDLVTAQENGGIVLGAFTGTGRLIGFVYSFPGLTASGRLKQCSIILAVDPDYQGRGIGFRLKLAQRDTALARGIDLITWTYDPLVSANAHFNFGKLGTVAATYLVNVYGDGYGINAGLETDRLLVEWWLRDAGRRRIENPQDGAPRVNRVDVSDGDQRLPVNGSTDLTRADDTVLIQVPRDIQAVKAADLACAQEWRRETRRMFRTYLERGYVVRGFLCPRDDRQAHPCYVLYRESARR